jgi:hypothetical protein
LQKSIGTNYNVNPDIVIKLQTLFQSYFIEMIVFNPQQLNDPLIHIREQCRIVAAEIANHALCQPFSKLTSVGAVFDGTQLVKAIEITLAGEATNICGVIKIPVSGQFKLTSMNRWDDKVSEDFIDPDLRLPETELLIIHRVYNSPRKRREDDETHTFSVSDYHFDENAWYKAALRCGAQVIVPKAEYNDVNPRDVHALCLHKDRLIKFQAPGINSKEINVAHFMGPAFAVVSADGFKYPFLVRKDLAEKIQATGSNLRIAMPG